MDKVKEVTKEVHLATIQAINDLDNFILKVANARKTANFLKWKIKNVVADETAGALLSPTKVTHPETKAQGLRYFGFDETFYNVHMAARYLRTNYIKIDEAITAGLLYTVKINNLTAIPQRALDLYNKAKK